MPEKPLFTMNPQETIVQLQDYYFPPYITLAHMFHAPSKWDIKNRVLKQYLLQYTVSGVAEYQIGNRDYPAREGDLLLLRPNERHSKKTGQDEPYVCISVVFHFGNAEFPFNELVKSPIYVGNFINHSINTKLSQLKSGKYLIKQFKQKFGMSPMQYLTWIRLEKAKQLAVQTTLSIGEIANRVGYADVLTFGKMFKKKTGINLSQFCATLFIDDPESEKSKS